MGVNASSKPNTTRFEHTKSGHAEAMSCQANIAAMDLTMADQELVVHSKRLGQADCLDQIVHFGTEQFKRFTVTLRLMIRP